MAACVWQGKGREGWEIVVRGGAGRARHDADGRAGPRLAPRLRLGGPCRDADALQNYFWSQGPAPFLPGKGGQQGGASAPPQPECPARPRPPHTLQLLRPPARAPPTAHPRPPQDHQTHPTPPHLPGPLQPPPTPPSTPWADFHLPNAIQPLPSRGGAAGHRQLDLHRLGRGVGVGGWVGGRACYAGTGSAVRSARPWAHGGHPRRRVGRSLRSFPVARPTPTRAGPGWPRMAGRPTVGDARR